MKSGFWRDFGIFDEPGFFVPQEFLDIVHEESRGTGERLARRAGDMGRHSHVVQLQELALRLKRLVVEHVEGRARDFLLPQCFKQGFRVDQARAGGVDQ